MQALTDAAKRVAAGEGREVLLISGEAGQGKTTLVAEAARAAFDGGACVLFGHCEEDLATPYQLFAEALGHYVTHAPEDQLLAHVETHGSELARLVPASPAGSADLPPSKAPTPTRSGSCSSPRWSGCWPGSSRTARGPGARRPPVGGQGKPPAASSSGGGRAGHADRSSSGPTATASCPTSHPLLDTLAALRRQNGVSRIELAGLDDTGVVALMEAAAGHALDDAGMDLAHAVYRETDGNPFFVSEVLRHLSETGAIYQDATGRWIARGSPWDRSPCPTASAR